MARKANSLLLHRYRYFRNVVQRRKQIIIQAILMARDLQVALIVIRLQLTIRALDALVGFLALQIICRIERSKTPMTMNAIGSSAMPAAGRSFRAQRIKRSYP